MNDVYENKLVIGGRRDTWGVSTVHCFAIKGEHSISENQLVYRAYNFGLFERQELVIFKAHKEGIALTKLIAKGSPIQVINKHLLLVCIKYLKPAHMYSLLANTIEDVKDREYERGRKDKLKEIQKALGLKRSYDGLIEAEEEC